MGFTIDKIVFCKLEQEYELFFKILPKDWSSEISPVWNQFKKKASIFILKYDAKVIGGGILFNTLAPDISYYNENVLSKPLHWFKNGYGYIAYFFILNEYRGKKLGIKWLNNLIETYPNKGFFLTIDDESLISFYEKSGFSLYDEIAFKDHKEWLLVRKSNLEF